MKILILALCIAVALAIPGYIPGSNPLAKKLMQQKLAKTGRNPDCGAYYMKFEPKPRPANRASHFWCEICEDLVQVIQMFADCEEAYLIGQADQLCDTACGNDGVLASICHDLADKLYLTVKNITDTNYVKVCSDLLKTTSGNIPANVTYPYKQECGLFVVPKPNFTIPNPRDPKEKANLWCGLCMDIVNIAEMYAECYESDAQDIALAWCDEHFDPNSDHKMNAVCRYLVNDVLQALEQFTESIDAAKVCTTVVYHNSTNPNDVCSSA